MPSKNCNITLVNTGGTISAELTDGVLCGGKIPLLNAFGNNIFKRALVPLNVLSENLDFEEIGVLHAALDRELKSEDCGAVIVTHGTDSLSFSASALSVLLGKIGKSVVFVSADYPLCDARTNGYKNMEAALDFIKKGTCGVYAAYKNPGEEVKIHMGARMYYTRADGYVWSAGKNKTACCPSGINEPRELPRITERSPRVIFVRPYPGLDYVLLNEFLIKNHLEAVFDSFHSGTIKTAGVNCINAIEVPCFFAAGKDGGLKYESQAQINRNITVFHNISPIALYYKAAFSAHMDKAARIEYLNANTAGEF
jgi:L-asparaginase